MTVPQLLSVAMGLLFMFTPMWIGVSEYGALLTSFLFGLIYFISSLMAVGKERKAWQHWAVICSGAWFILLPFIYGFSLWLAIAYVCFAVASVLLVFYNMEES